MTLLWRLAPVVLLAPGAFSQTTTSLPPKPAAGSPERVIDSVFAYLNMASTVGKTATFQPLTQAERNRLFGVSLVNPVWYAKGAISAAQNQFTDTPKAWEQGASGYGKRYGDIMGQYAIRKTVTFGLESMLHEDNRYFPSGKTGFWPRTGYALSCGLLARGDNGRRHPSASLLVGMASGAYLSRFWQPADNRSVGDAAVSFGTSMAWNMAVGVVKEFLPDLLRPLTKRAPHEKRAGGKPESTGPAR
jgi:hypothetical protein